MNIPKSKRDAFHYFHNLWIIPEIEKRRKEGTWSDDSRIEKYLIKLPKNAPPIVLLNDEVIFNVRVRKPKDISIQEGDPVYLHQIENIESVELPSIDGERVAFVYLFPSGKKHSLVFDLTPNLLSHLEESKLKEEAALQCENAIALSLRDMINGLTFQISASFQKPLTDFGLWPIPALMPYPLSAIVEALSQENKDKATTLIIERCTPEFLSILISKWKNSKLFQVRSMVFNEALDSHNNGKFLSAIRTLLPELEGIISDWVESNLAPSETPPFRQESKTKKFRDLVLKESDLNPIFEGIVNQAIDFIIQGPVLETFKSWKQAVSANFPHRHAISHGRLDSELYTEINSIKLFLLLDTIFYILEDKA
ncbi:hypothetical protein [Leptospira licerasiae]|uniref:hypothetical protein n=1 Tax=Leptospira licerasiae TaxID=447106 RepID=UPI0030179535